jgi:hypothetical protein
MQVDPYLMFYNRSSPTMAQWTTSLALDILVGDTVDGEPPFENGAHSFRSNDCCTFLR